MSAPSRTYRPRSVPAGAADARLLAACITFQAAWAAELAAYGHDDLPDRLTSATQAAAREVQALTPATFAGMREKARVGYVMVVPRVCGADCKDWRQRLVADDMLLAVEFLADMAGEVRS